MNKLLKCHKWMFLHQNTTFIEMQSLSTINTEMQYWMEGVYRNTAFIQCDAAFEFNVITGCCVQKKSIYCDATIEYSGHRNIVYV